MLIAQERRTINFEIGRQPSNFHFWLYPFTCDSISCLATYDRSSEKVTLTPTLSSIEAMQGDLSCFCPFRPMRSPLVRQSQLCRPILSSYLRKDKVIHGRQRKCQSAISSPGFTLLKQVILKSNGTSAEHSISSENINTFLPLTIHFAAEHIANPSPFLASGLTTIRHSKSV